MSTLDNPFKDSPTVSNTQVAVRYGAITSVILIVIGLIGYVTGLTNPANSNQTVTWISSLLNYGIIIGGMVLAVREHRDTNQGGFITFGKAFGTGFKTVLVLTAIQAIWMYVFMAFIAPELKDQIIQTAIDQAAEKGQDPEQVEAGMKMMSWMFNPPMMAAIVFITFLFMGSIFALVIAAVLKKDQEKV
ncbi:DUF4199 domain-containing protein [Haliscomenobacter sp.]|uniref:DUF4199 domain-containing protein n=1 Tax=Haliscomenobacter sp. TaxID=2717303 RepID=UPI003364FC76